MKYAAAIFVILFILPMSASAAYNLDNAYFSSTYQEVLRVPVVSGDIVSMQQFVSSNVGNNNLNGNIEYLPPGYTSSTTAKCSSFGGNTGGANAACTPLAQYTATSSGTLQVMNGANGSVGQDLQVFVYAVASNSSGSTTSSSQNFATNSQNALVVDNPTGDLFTGVLCFFMVAAFVIWLLR